MHVFFWFFSNVNFYEPIDPPVQLVRLVHTAENLGKMYGPMVKLVQTWFP
jgi:hypothetical protein